jgi:spermidine synthase
MLFAALLFFFSGAGGLIYEIVWLKILGLQFGASAWAVATVVSSFMAGLGIGSWWAGRLAQKIERPLLVYAWLELGIALCGLCSVPLLHHLDVLVEPIYHVLEDHFTIFAGVRFLCSFLVLLLPTALMGASLPVLVVGLSLQDSFKKAVGLLYGINTLGAAFGVFLSSFVLLPAIGLQATVLVAVGIGIAVGIAAILWNMMNRLPPIEITPVADGHIPGDLSLVAFTSGGIALFCEVCWTRLLMPVVGSSTYAFAIILIVFLLGIGLGSLWLASRFAPRQGYRAWIAAGFGTTALCIVATTFLVNLLPQFMVTLAPWCGRHIWLLFMGQLVIVASLVLLPTCLLGAVLPLATIAYQAETEQKGRAVGGMYVANTFGAILGSLAAGFAFLPYAGVYLSLLLIAAVSLIVAVLILLREQQLTRPRKILSALAITAVFVVLLSASPQTDVHHLQQGVFRRILSQKSWQPTDYGDLLFAEDGATSTVTVYRFEERTSLKINGKVDASTQGDIASQYLLGHLPLFLTSTPRNVCVIGLGSGATVKAAASHPVARVDVVELEPAVVNAYPWFASVHDNVLDDSRVHLHIEDGRSFLRYSRRQYDVIISEPSNPWISGVSALFTSEFYRIVKSRLHQDGIFCQWIQSYEISAETLCVMLRTLSDEFAHVLLFTQQTDLICLASQQPICGSEKIYSERMANQEVGKTLERIQIDNAYALLSGYIGSLPEGNAYFQTLLRNSDDNLWLEYRAPVEMYSDERPNITLILPLETYLAQCQQYLFPNTDKSQIIKQLFVEMANTEPMSWRRLQAVANSCQQESDKQALTACAMKAKKRWELIVESPQKLGQVQIMLQHKEWQQAIPILHELLPTSRKASAYRYLGEIYTQQRDFQTAFEWYAKALAANPDDYIACANIALLYYLTGDIPNSDKYFEISLQLNPHYVASRGNWIKLLNSQRRTEDAARLKEEAKRLLRRDKYAQLEKMIRN